MSDTPDSEGPARTAAEDRTRESRPRRVILRRDENGSYCIFMGREMIQGFCSQFEDITGFSMGVDTQQQVRIAIESIGRRQRARYPDRLDRPDALIRHRDPGEAVMTRATEQGIEQEEVALFSSAHPGNPTITMTWQDEARQALQEQMTRMQHMLNLLESL
ncbi:hypothetical protein LCGC14_0367460 [marine sediment metagenome]|uniref:Uncharacterized protein n=1 Tax=marine sediment metagenome TaxID=412755 RepID=A0A0F9T6E3_9ZZZZ